MLFFFVFVAETAESQGRLHLDPWGAGGGQRGMCIGHETVRNPIPARHTHRGNREDLDV